MKLLLKHSTLKLSILIALAMALLAARPPAANASSMVPPIDRHSPSHSAPAAARPVPAGSTAATAPGTEPGLPVPPALRPQENGELPVETAPQSDLLPLLALLGFALLIGGTLSDMRERKIHGAHL